MRNTKKNFVMAVVILTIFLLPLQVALADPAKEMGCISKEPGSTKLKFFTSDFPIKKR